MRLIISFQRSCVMLLACSHFELLFKYINIQHALQPCVCWSTIQFSISTRVASLLVFVHLREEKKTHSSTVEFLTTRPYYHSDDHDRFSIHFRDVCNTRCKSACSLRLTRNAEAPAAQLNGRVPDHEALWRALVISRTRGVGSIPALINKEMQVQVLSWPTILQFYDGVEVVLSFQGV